MSRTKFECNNGIVVKSTVSGPNSGPRSNCKTCQPMDDLELWRPSTGKTAKLIQSLKFITNNYKPTYQDTLAERHWKHFFLSVFACFHLFVFSVFSLKK